MPSSRAAATRTLPPGAGPGRRCPGPTASALAPRRSSAQAGSPGTTAGPVSPPAPRAEVPRTGDSSSDPGDPIHYQFNSGNRLIRLSVRRARFGPGLWPGPCRQARWAGRGLRRSRAGPADRFCEAVRNDLRVPLTLEGPARTMRGVPARLTVTSSRLSGAPGASGDGLAVVLAGAAAGYGGDRRRPVTGAAVRGSSPRRRARVRRTRRKLPPRNGETPGEPRPPTAGHPGRSSPRDCSRPSSLFTAGAVRPGAPKVRP